MSKVIIFILAGIMFFAPGMRLGTEPEVKTENPSGIEIGVHTVSSRKQEQGGKNVSRSAPIFETAVFEATAYCSCKKCCGKTDGITKSGVKVHQGTLAVDPKVIPLGSKVYIEGMGWFIAEDTGSFRGKRIDIYMETHEKALQFGRKKVRVMLEQGMI